MGSCVLMLCILGFGTLDAGKIGNFKTGTFVVLLNKKLIFFFEKLKFIFSIDTNTQSYKTIIACMLTRFQLFNYFILFSIRSSASIELRTFC
jgi:hypothetical protein